MGGGDGDEEEQNNKEKKQIRSNLNLFTYLRYHHQICVNI